MVQFVKTKEWDEIVKYAETPKKHFGEVREAKPPREVVKRALADLLENCKFKNCTINQGYLKALGLIKP